MMELMYICHAFGVSYCRYRAFGHFPLFGNSSALSEAEIARIQKELGKYAERTMACFVTGDIPLDDENWQVFCDKVHELGLDDAVSIWQKYVTKGNE